MSDVAAWVEAIGTILVAFIAVFHDFVYRWLTRPVLGLSVSGDPPCCHMVRWGREARENGKLSIQTGPVYYLTMRIENKGRRPAENTQVKLTEISRKQLDGSFVPYDEFSPMNLQWSFRANEAFLPTIHPHTYEFCALAHIYKPADRDMPFEQRTWPEVDPAKTILSIDTVVKSFSLPHLLPAGTYQMHITVSSSEARPIHKVVEVSLSGEWFDDAKKMREDGVAIGLLS